MSRSQPPPHAERCAAPAAGRGANAVAAALAPAGITLNGGQPWDPRVCDPRFFGRLMRGGLVALGDAYVDGDWECERLDQFFDRAGRADLPARLPPTPNLWRDFLAQRLFNLQSLGRAKRNARAHYNIGNDLFEVMLDPTMTYTCAYWKNARTLEEAQTAKLDLVCRKLGLAPGMRVLDIGCGWGSFARHAAKTHGARVVGITLSQEQLAFGKRFCAGLEVDLQLADYRLAKGTFDRVVSLGMFEHVGPGNYGVFMDALGARLADDGLALLHFFASRDPFPNLHSGEVNWITKHIFPGMVVPSLGQVGRALDGRFVLEDLHNFGVHYDPTLMAWHANFERGWPMLAEKYGERFARMWRYYLLSCAGSFRARKYQLWQTVLSKRGVPGGYESVR